MGARRVERKGVPEYPWYEERMIFMGEKKESPKPLEGAEGRYSSPRDIYNYLDERIWKQAEAKEAATMIMYYTIHNIRKTNAMFVGPTGCGKTEIWRCLQKLFPDRVEIVDGSNVTNDGWKGEKKWSTLFDSPIFRTTKNTILVIDEADKMLSPKITSSRENIAESIMAEGLKMMEGIDLNVGEEHAKYHVDTRTISIVFCGAFSRKANEIAASSIGSSIGFFAKKGDCVEAYDKPLTREDIMDFGVMPEFMGRIQRLVNLQPMTEDDYLRLVTESKCGTVSKLEEEYGRRMSVDLDYCKKLISEAAKSGLGVRGFENMLRNRIDEMLFNDHTLQWCHISDSAHTANNKKEVNANE